MIPIFPVHDLSTSEAELVRAWAQGDRHAGDILLERNFDAIARFFANKVGTELDDLVQQTFERAQRGAARFEGKSSFRTFLFGIAHNVLREYLRQKNRRQQVDELTSVQDLELEPHHLMVRSQEERLLLSALRRLPIADQTLLELFYWEDLTGPALAEILAVPEGTIRSRLRKARQRLEEQLQRVAQSPELLTSTLSSLETWARGLKARQTSL